MYVEFLSSDFAQRSICVSSALDRIDVSTDAASVRISLFASDHEFYVATLYAFDGQVSILDLASVIESYFRRKGWHMHTVKIAVSAVGDTEVSAVKNLNVLYCSYDLPADYNPSKSFFSCVQAQRVPPSAILNFYGIVNANSPVRLNVSGFTDNGFPTACQIQQTSFDGYVKVDVPAIIAKCKSDFSMSQVSIISVFYGDIVKSLFICDIPDYLEFRYRNCFNCPETAFVSGASVMKTEVSRDLALCAGQSLQYNHLTSRTYEHTTAPLTRMEAAAMSQLIESRSVSVIIAGKEYPVIITDHTSEVSNDDSSLNTMKFVWHFTGKRPRLFGDTLLPLMESFGIFTQEFDEQFQ